MNCEECRIGRYQPVNLSYLYPLGQQMVIIPNAPAYVCDVCKSRHYDPYFLETLDFLLTRLSPLDTTKPTLPQQPALSSPVAEYIGRLT
jgi:YgiT-type zinc finger domain-containing protein